MLSITQIYILCSLLLLSQAATIPKTPLAAISANLGIPSIHQNATANLGVDLNLGATRIMTRSLPEHNCFLRIQYYTHLRLPQPWQLVIARAQLLIARALLAYGDGALPSHSFQVVEGNVEFVAGRYIHSPSPTLTLGILDEAVQTVAEFLQEWPCCLYATILEGIDGRGPPIGDVMMLEREDLQV